MSEQALNGNTAPTETPVNQPAQPAESKYVPISFRPENMAVRRLVETKATELVSPDEKPNNSKAINHLLTELLQLRQSSLKLEELRQRAAQALTEMQAQRDQLAAQNESLKAMLEKIKAEPKNAPNLSNVVLTEDKREISAVNYVLSKIQNFGYFGSRAYLEKTLQVLNP